MRLQWRPYQWTLKRPLQSARGLWRERCGWLLRLEATGSGAVGWGEAAPLPPQHNACAEAISALPAELSHEALNTAMAELPKPVAFALGLALCELEAVHGHQKAGGVMCQPPGVLGWRLGWPWCALVAYRPWPGQGAAVGLRAGRGLFWPVAAPLG